MTSFHLPSSNLLEDIRTAWQAGTLMDAVLSRLVIETDARAAGFWRLEQGQLQLAGFGGASDMPVEVSQGFQEATRRVSLDQTGLGIVKATLTNQPVIALRDPRETGLVGSASWIVKFRANSSLAVPIRDQQNGKFLGVFAISTESTFTEGDELWNAMLRIAQELGQ